MSDQNGVNTPTGGDGSPSTQQNEGHNNNYVPKDRLDELIQEKRALTGQLEVLQHLVRSAVPSQRQAPMEEPPHWKQIKEESPATYQELKRQAMQQKQLNALQFQTQDNQDRLQYLQEFGADGSKRLNEVEAKLNELRERGIHHFNRGQILVHLEGADALQKRRTPQAQAPVAQQAQAPQGSVPSSDPNAAAVISSGSAGSGKASPKETLEEMEKRLANETF